MPSKANINSAIALFVIFFVFSYSPQHACRIIPSCVVLHNRPIALSLQEPKSDNGSESDSDSVNEDEVVGDNNAAWSGHLLQDRIVQRNFRKLILFSIFEIVYLHEYHLCSILK